jgi:hypothetical protein
MNYLKCFTSLCHAGGDVIVICLAASPPAEPPVVHLDYCIAPRSLSFRCCSVLFCSCSLALYVFISVIITVSVLYFTSISSLVIFYIYLFSFFLSFLPLSSFFVHFFHFQCFFLWLSERCDVVAKHSWLILWRSEVRNRESCLRFIVLIPKPSCGLLNRPESLYITVIRAYSSSHLIRRYITFVSDTTSLINSSYLKTHTYWESTEILTSRLNCLLLARPLCC